MRNEDLMSGSVVGVISLDRALIWRESLEPKTAPEKVVASEDNPDYKKEKDRKESGRDRSEMSDEFCESLVPYFAQAEKIFLISAGTGKANAGEVFLDYLSKKHKAVADRVLEVAKADVNKLTDNELLEIGRLRFSR
jgi:hypothetical protein